MKVICIKEDSYFAFSGRVCEPDLIVGREYTVVDIMHQSVNGVLNEYFRLEEIVDFMYYNTKLFAIISSIDELELVNEKEEVYG